MIQSISTDKAPQAIGPYSQAIRSGEFIFLSGQIPLNPVTNEVAGNDIVTQTVQVLNNIKAILEGEGLSLNHVVKTTIFLQDMNQFVQVNEEYGKFFTDHRPARSTVEVSKLPKGVLIEIEAIAYTG
jgi:2-iminobutanoate/2-iminopropanoate deaminase